MASELTVQLLRVRIVSVPTCRLCDDENESLDRILDTCGPLMHSKKQTPGCILGARQDIDFFDFKQHYESCQSNI